MPQPTTHLARRLASAMLAATAVTTLGVMPVAAQDGAERPFPAVDLSNPAAPFVFTHATAIEKGATAEWRKMEGVAYSAASSTLFVAVTSIGKGMADAEGDIQLAENPCGVVYAGALDADLALGSLTPVVTGGPYDEADAANPCSTASIANPDNLFVAPNGDLWIGEDSSLHDNDVLWVWDGSELKRFATVPDGAEVTGLRIEPDGTIFLNIQHPAAANRHPYNRATVGVITGYKAGEPFEPIDVPSGDASRELVLAAGSYTVLGRTGEALPGNGAEGAFGDVLATDGSRIDQCNNPDGNMYLPTVEDGSQGYLYTNWECAPSAISRIYIERDADGGWTATDGELVDLAEAPMANLCNASVTPWNTGLTSEEYPADVEDEWPSFVEVEQALARQTGTEPADPLAYGYISELVPAGGEDDPLGTTVTKHYVMGRFSHELALVLPDEKTVYFGDDGTDRVLYRFVADTAGDLSAGTLSAAKVDQKGETLRLEWIELGSGNDADIEAAMAALPR